MFSCLKMITCNGTLQTVSPLIITGILQMALADLVHDVTIDMKGQLHHPPKYVDTFRKVDAGMVNAAGKRFPYLLCLAQVTK